MFMCGFKYFLQLPAAAKCQFKCLLCRLSPTTDYWIIHILCFFVLHYNNTAFLCASAALPHWTSLPSYTVNSVAQWWHQMRFN